MACTGLPRISGYDVLAITPASCKGKPFPDDALTGLWSMILSSTTKPVTRVHLADGPFKPDWVSVIGITLLHLGAFLALFPMFFSWTAVIAAVIMYWACGGLGITLGYHRLLTHRSFKTWKPIEYFVAILGTLNWQGGPATWVGTHRLHHAESDQDGDPHTPHHGFTWAHATWCLKKHPKGYEPRQAAKDLLRDPIMAAIDKYFIVPLVAVTVLFYVLGEALGTGGWSMVIWAVCVRTVVGYHTTWLVNSAAHTWGYRNFKTTDDSRNNFWVALLSFGEGWHNNHHAQQRSAAHGMRWWEFDITYLTIRMMSMVGLAWDVVKPVPAFDNVPGKAADAAAGSHEKAKSSSREPGAPDVVATAIKSALASKASSPG